MRYFLFIGLILTGCEVQSLTPVDPATTVAPIAGAAVRDDRITGRWSLDWPPGTGQPDGEIAVIDWDGGQYRASFPASAQSTSLVWLVAESRWSFSYLGKTGQTVRVRFSMRHPDLLDGLFTYTIKGGSVSGILPMHRMPSAPG
jgi:hypothetical protein